MRASIRRKYYSHKTSKSAATPVWFIVFLAIFIISCEETSLENLPSTYKGPYTDFSPVTYDIDAAPDGSILVTENNMVKEIRDGEVSNLIEIPTIPGSPVNGVETVGRQSYFITSGGLDLAAGAGVWHVTGQNAQLIGDIEAFETQNDPDAFEGPQWKDPACEEDPNQGFSAGPQSNPYHLKSISGSKVLVADAAGNSLLSVEKNGNIDWVAVFTPPVDENGDRRILFSLPGGTDCYVQPVPTSVDIGPDGAVYVGELTGAPAVPGWSRIWRIASGASNVTCPSADCSLAFDGLTSVIELEFGPDGLLYVVEYDANGWLAATTGNAAGGTIKTCDIDTGDCKTLFTDLPFPTAITFDKWKDLYLLESNISAPSVRKLDLP
ncbi:MAG: ScyD/ScyE family protein [Balneolaceae bacterium]|nr:ScyD/ScyE family protein [Balneolaceae bacterium]